MKNKLFKIFIVIAVCGTLIAATIPTTRVPLEAGKFLYTACKPWKTLRTPATETGSAAYDFTANNGCWADICVDTTTIDATNGLIDLMEIDGDGWGGNGIQIGIYVTDPNDADGDTCDIEIFGFADSLYGPAIPLYATTGNHCQVGTRICTTNPVTGAAQANGLWVDTIAGTTYDPSWYVVNNGNNSICLVCGDMKGFRYIWVRVFNADGSGTEAKMVGLVYRTW